MLEILQDPLCWVILLIFYFGIAVFFIGNARNNNAVISGFGIIIALGSVIFSMIHFTWWFGIILVLFGYITSLPFISIPVLLGYIYWKIRYNPKYLTMFRYHGLIFEQYQKTSMRPLLTYAFIDKAVEDGVGKKEVLQDCVEKVFKTESKFVSEELFSDYKIFKEFVARCRVKNFNYAINVLKRDLGIVPMTKTEVLMFIDDIVEEASKNANRRNK